MLRQSLKDFVKIELNEGALEALQWKDFGNGLFMSRLVREGKSELVLYRVRADADSAAFLKHEHIGGEIYLVLKGEISDECGVYREGDIVYLDPKSVHTPRGIGETVVLVLWPAGVKVVD
ncbi:MAG: cupin domain-containing protein [Candidatus Binatia bacterium]